MGRPRADAGGPSAKERMHEAFWTLLSDDPSSPVSVRELCARAKVNKNAFYYHYAGVEALADEAMTDVIGLDKLQRLLSVLQGSVDTTSIDPNDTEALGRICLMAGASGTPRLRYELKSAIANAWDGLPGAHPRGNDTAGMLDREFALEGILGVLASLWEDESYQHLDRIRGVSYPRYTMELIGCGLLATQDNN